VVKIRKRRKPSKFSTEWFRERLEKLAPPRFQEERARLYEWLASLPKPKSEKEYGRDAARFILAQLHFPLKFQAHVPRRRGRPKSFVGQVLLDEVVDCLRSCGLSQAKGLRLVRDLRRIFFGEHVDLESLKANRRKQKRKEEIPGLRLAYKQDPERARRYEARLRSWADAVRKDWDNQAGVAATKRPVNSRPN
jgi:hypothetical protein